MRDQSTTRPKPLLWMILPVLVCVVVAAGAWWIYHHFWGTQAKEFEIENSGHFGPTSTSSSKGFVAIKAPYWRKGDRLALSGYAEYPGKPRGPVFLILLRLKDKNTTESISSVGSGKDSVAHLHVQYTDIAQQPFWIKYQLENEPITEKVSLGEKTVDLKEGRLFMVDLRVQPVSVTQLKQDITDLLLKEDAGAEDLKSAVEKLMK